MLRELMEYEELQRQVEDERRMDEIADYYACFEVVNVELFGEWYGDA